MIKEYFKNKVKDIKFETKYEKSLEKINDLENQIKVLKRKLNDDYKTNIILNLQKDLKKQKEINKNLREDNLRLMKGMKK